MYRIGSRVVKTAFGSALAIFIAQSIGVNFYSSAGIIAILCIQPTRRRSLETAIRRFLACILNIIFCLFFFYLFGYTAVAIGLLLLFFIPSLVMFKIQEGVISSSVIMLHLYNLEKITVPIILNEIIVIVIGIGVALLCNLYMPSLDDQIKSFKVKIDSKFCFIFEKISIYLKEPSNKCFLEEYEETVILLQKAKNTSKLEIDNHYFKLRNDEDYEYFLLRERQLEVIYRIIKTVCNIKVSNEQSHILSKFFNDLSYSINPKISGTICLHQLEEIYQMFRSMPLPQTADDFETRAAVLTIIHEMESFLIMKSKFKGKYFKVD
ncbi:aromatic acid exporter family protein [Gottfriedia luciferensis]|uniref:aromatic acid exporter family protein n=1 Tax=Gottfriedia luciferensis TaxID=178774 RepID=UPI000B4490A4|nr:aromatic acid exporter family protein [Gottfriedia luciferensis]